MPATPFDSATYRDLFLDREIGTLFTDSADIRAMMVVEGALAKVQAQLGVIPEISGMAIHRASTEILIDPGALASETGQSAVVVPALVKAFRAEMKAPEHAQYIHWGATSQDIMDTGLVLRLRQVLALYEARLKTLLTTLARIASRHADLPMAARTYGQTATVTSFGAVVASWGNPLLRHLQRLESVRADLLQVSLSGAAGTLSAMGPKGPEVRAELAKALRLGDPGGSWHVERDSIAALSSWITGVAMTLGKIGEDLLLLTQSDTGEVTLASGGGSSTMPQKSNPVLPSILVALARHIATLNSGLQTAGMQRQQRDGAAWFVEWLSLPQVCLGLGRGLSAAQELADGMTPNADSMRSHIDDGTGFIYAEALSFALCKTLSRPDAQAATKMLCAKVRETGRSLSDIAAEAYPDSDFADLFTPEAQLGTAPAEALAFAARVQGL